MNRTASTIISVIVVLLVILGIYYWAKSGRENTINYDNTESPTDNTNSQSGTPVVSTRNAAFILQTSAVLNGDVNPSSSQTSYWYEYGETSSLGSVTSPQLIGGGNIVYSAPKALTGLKANTTYYFSIVAENENGKVMGNISSFTTTNTNTAPVTYISPFIETKNATAITPRSAILNGSINTKGPAASYWFEYGKDFRLGSVTPVTAADASATTITVASAVANLEPNTTYYFRLDGQNVYGTVTGNISVFTTQPTTPTTGTPAKIPTSSTTPATSITSTTARLNGSVNPNGTTTTYYFKYGKSTPFGLFDLDQRTPNSTAGAGLASATVGANVTNLEPNATYYFQVVAENANGSSSGAIYSFTTKSP
jgi:hypothetical protein